MNNLIHASLWSLIGLVSAIIFLPLIKFYGIKLKYVDIPDFRKLHKSPIPALGGLGVYLSLLIWFALQLFMNNETSIPFQWALFMIVLLGFVDDIRNLPSSFRLLIQVLAASLVVYNGFALTSLFGIFGITSLSPVWSFAFSVLLITGVSNAFNLIDGIDGLSGGLSFITCGVLGYVCFLQNDWINATFFFTTAGALIGFLLFNLPPARMFMGDCGSLALGFIFSSKGITLINYTTETGNNLSKKIIILIVALMIIPVADTLRLFITRFLQGKSPFTADTNHIHHILLKLGNTHLSASVKLFVLMLIQVMSGVILSGYFHISTIILILLFEYSAIIIFSKLKTDKASIKAA